ncbi:MAG: ABC transporter ATP-binding protein, partial [Deltaproteobacteria bacterium]|nr:ABC transporter ATP-binding protein [Deltaproteobacteria bacterium]
MRRINGILDEVPQITNQTTNPFRGVIRGEVCLKGLTFYYPKEKDPALKDIYLRTEAGQTVAIVGGVGSGKSTLLQIIPRLIETERNMVQIDEIPIHNIDLKNLRTSIGFVTQETHIFSDTIFNNIIFGREGVGEDFMRNILEISQLAVDINSFPKGIHSVLGERGITLSGGQR